MTTLHVDPPLSAASTGTLECVGPYALVREVGRGGMGVVYLARDLRTRASVALKLLPRHLARDEAYRDRFSREAELAARIDHPSVVGILDHGFAGERPWIAMPFVDGITLEDLLAQRRVVQGGRDPRQWISNSTFILDGEDSGPQLKAVQPVRGRPRTRRTAGFVPETVRDASRITWWSRVLRWGEGLADALHHLHSRGVLHCDMKPSNVLIDRKGEAHLIDFGLARERDGEDDLPKVMMGTAHYMAPEQVRVERVDPRTDVHALGILMYECLTLERPFERRTPDAVLWAIANEDPRSPCEVSPELSADAEALLMRAIAKDPRDRYPSAAAMRQDLMRLRSFQPLVRRQVWVQRAAGGAFRPRWRKLTLAGLAAGFLGLGFALASWPSAEPSQEPLAVALQRAEEAFAAGRPELAQAWLRMAGDLSPGRPVVRPAAMREPDLHLSHVAPHAGD